MTLAVAEQRAGADARIAHHHRFDPFRARCSARMPVTSRLSFRPVTRRKPSRSRLPRSPVRQGCSARRAVKISLHDGRPAHHHLAVLDADIEAGQRLAHRSRLAASRPVDGDDRAAFGQAIAFMHGDAEVPGPLGQRRRDRRAADRDEAQALRRSLAPRLELGDPGREQLRDEHRRRRAPLLELVEHVGRATSADALRDGGGKMRPRADKHRHADGGDGLEQQRERQDRQMEIARGCFDRLGERRACQSICSRPRRTPFGRPVLPDV